MERRALSMNRSTPSGSAAKGATSVAVGQAVTYGTVFYPEGDQDRKGAYPGDEAAQWYCHERLHHDLFGKKPGELALVAFCRVESDVYGARGPRTYVWAKFRRIK